MWREMLLAGERDGVTKIRYQISNDTEETKTETKVQKFSGSESSRIAKVVSARVLSKVLSRVLEEAFARSRKHLGREKGSMTFPDSTG